VNLADGIALARAVAVLPVIVLVATGSDTLALVVFAAAALSDAIDGPVARARDEVTARGEWLDPLADKVLIAGTLAALAARGLVPLWALVIVLGRELAAIAVRSRSPHPLPATADGKAKTVLQALAVAMTLLAADAGSAPVAATAAIVLAAALGLTVVSGLRLILRAAQTAAHAR